MANTYIHIPNELREFKAFQIEPGETLAQAIHRSEDEGRCWIWYKGYKGDAVVAENIADAKDILNHRQSIK